MQISIEKLVEIIVREVLKELLAKGIVIDTSLLKINEEMLSGKMKSAEIDMSGFKTPVLTENQLTNLDSSITEVIIPPKTIITSGATDLIKKKLITIVYKSN